jgi:hypothetical protein
MKKRRDRAAVINGSTTSKLERPVWGRSSVLFVVCTCWYDDAGTPEGCCCCCFSSGVLQYPSFFYFNKILKAQNP